LLDADAHAPIVPNEPRLQSRNQPQWFVYLRPELEDDAGGGLG
jgi:hypothetical protein